MLADDIADRIAIACPDEIDGIIKDMWVDHTHGLLADNEMETLDEAARARREAIQARRTETRSRTPQSAPRGSARRRQRSPDKQASIERRRRLVASGPLPPPLAARFTWGEIAVMRIVGDECRVHGCCTLHIDAIAARAGVHRTTVQNALREAHEGTPGRPAIITVQERRRRGQRSLTNIIRISREWRDWLQKGPSRPAMGVGSKRTAIKKSNTTDTGLFLRGTSPWGIPDGVYSCEEVI